MKDGAVANSFIHRYSFKEQINCSDIKWLIDSGTVFLTTLSVIAGATVCLVLSGLFLNIVIVIVLRHLREDSVFSLNLSALAISDIFVLFFNGFDLWCHLVEIFPNLNSAATWIIIYIHPFCFMFREIFIAIRNWSIVFLVIIRAIKVHSPFKVHDLVTKRSVTTLFVIQGIINFLLNAAKVFEPVTKVANCSNGIRIHVTSSHLLPRPYMWSTTLILNSFLPIVICIIANGILLSELRKSMHFRRGSTTGQRTSERKSIRIVIFVSIVFIICQLPMVFELTIEIVKFPSTVFVTFITLQVLISAIDSSCNFFIYMWGNTKFKRGIRRFLGSSIQLQSQQLPVYISRSETKL